MGLFSSKPREGPHRTGRIVNLPARGRAVIASDLHGHLGDFEALLARTKLRERLLAGEDLYLVITGDVPDLERHRAIDPVVTSDGDVRIIDRLLELERELGERASRIVYLEGNHDFHVLRIAREIAIFDAKRRGTKPPPRERWEPIDPDARVAYFEHYRRTYGDDVFVNNVQPYDMVERVEPRHLEWLAKQPILAVLEGAATLVTHAGPPKMTPHTSRSVRKAIEKATREELSSSTADAYYASPYHQILNNRFRAKDYDVDDVTRFLEAFACTLLVTGHTPHPYLVDYARQGPLDGCSFRDGLGFVGRHQVVLCTSFGAFDSSRKRYVELDLARPYASVDDLRSNVEVHPVYPEAAASTRGMDETKAILRSLVPSKHSLAQRRTAQFDPNAITDPGD